MERPREVLPVPGGPRKLWSIWLVTYWERRERGDAQEDRTFGCGLLFCFSRPHFTKLDDGEVLYYSLLYFVQTVVVCVELGERGG